MKVSVLIVDDHQILLQGLHLMLKVEPAIELVGQASDGRTAVQMVKELRPDVVVMDIQMPGLNGIDATRQILVDRPNTRVVALSANFDQRSISEMLRAGATGFVAKDAAFEELVDAIRAASRGEIYMSRSFTRFGVDDATRRQANSVFNILSGREREVLQLMSEGSANKQIAIKLHLSVKTIETHRRNIMAKLNIDNVAELTKYALREGITSL